jgi:hypothetical protein
MNYMRIFLAIASVSVCVYVSYIMPRGHAVAQWLRHYATKRKVAGSIPDGVTGSFH